MADASCAHRRGGGGASRGQHNTSGRRGRRRSQRGHPGYGPSLQAWNGQSDCAVCKRTLRSVCHTTFHFKFSVDFKQWRAASNQRRQEYLKTFLQMASTLLNEGGGYILMHVDNLSVAFFDEQVDGRLMELVGDGSMFDENFERKLVDNKHIVLRVLPSQSRPLSVCDFKSMMSMDRGRAKIDYVQMMHLLRRPRRPPLPLPSAIGEQQLREGHAHPFHEGRSLQAKAVKPDDLQKAEGNTTGEKLFHLSWNSLNLPSFITAFSKQRQGGYYYLGLEEEKAEPVQKWEPVERTSGLSGIFGTEKKFWCDKGNEDKKQREGWKGRKEITVHVAADNEVPRGEGRTTGRYICRGVRLAPQDQQDFRRLLYQHQASDLYWHPNQPADDLPIQSLLQCRFCPVLEPRAEWQNDGADGGPQRDADWIHTDLYLVEVRIAFYPGVCFHDVQGPEAFRYVHRNNPSRGEVVRVPALDCCALLATGRPFSWLNQLPFNAQ